MKSSFTYPDSGIGFTDVTAAGEGHAALSEETGPNYGKRDVLKIRGA